MLILVPAFGYRYLHWNSIFAFWFAYIMTRPLGASFSDWMARDLGWGTGPVSLALTLLILLLVGFLAYQQNTADKSRHLVSPPAANR